MFSCSTTWEINHQKWTLKAARLERLPVLVLHTACDLGKYGKKWCNLVSSKRKWAMPWLPCNVQQKWSSGCPAEWFGNWGSNKHRSCWLLTIDWDWSCGVPKMLCFPSQFIICWRELGVLMSEFCTTISWVCKRQNWSKPNRMWTVLSEKHVIVICSSINMCVTSRAYDIMDSQLTFTFWSGGFTNKPMQFTPAACTRSSEKTRQNAWNSQPYFFVQWECRTKRSWFP